MWPEPLFHLFDRPVSWYFLIYAGALIPAVALGLGMARRRNASWKLGMDGALAAVVLAWSGSRLLYAVQWSLDGSLHQSFPHLLLHGAQASIGALGGLLIGLAIVFRWKREIPSPLAAFDVVVPGVALFQGIARLGCFAAGCCYGTPAPGLPIAVTFSDPRSACQLVGLELHPAQLYLVIGNLLIAGALTVLFWQGERFRGALLAIYLITYGLLRFTVEFVRADHRPFLGPLSVNQWICLVFIGIGASLAFVRARQRPPTAPVQPSQPGVWEGPP